MEEMTMKTEDFEKYNFNDMLSVLENEEIDYQKQEF